MKAEKNSVEKPLKAAPELQVKYEKNPLDKDAPTLIMLPGGPGIVDHSLYTDFWFTLSSEIQVVVLEQRGNGRSDRGNPALWTMKQCAKDVVSFCDALGLEKPIVAGVSWGGYVTIRYAIDFPEHAKALILMHTEAKVDPEARSNAFVSRARQSGLSDDVEAKEVDKVVQDYDFKPLGEGVREKYLEIWAKYYGKNAYQKADFEACFVYCC